MARRINLNEADMDELAQVPGLGQRSAEMLIDYRNEHGEFEDWSDLDNVPGLSKSVIQEMQRAGVEI
jgi:competence protein ComEA